MDDGWLKQPHLAESERFWSWVRLHTCRTLSSQCAQVNPADFSSWALASTSWATFWSSNGFPSLLCFIIERKAWEKEGRTCGKCESPGRPAGEPPGAPSGCSFDEHTPPLSGACILIHGLQLIHSLVLVPPRRVCVEMVNLCTQIAQCATGVHPHPAPEFNQSLPGEAA